MGEWRVKNSSTVLRQSKIANLKSICYNCAHTTGTMTRDTDAYLYEQIAETVRLRIAQGELQPGERLPAVREMARQWGCTPGTVSRAYAILAEEGLVTGHRGSGTSVTESPLPPQQSLHHWATLINRSERFLLEAVAQGYSPPQVQSALSIALARWQTLQETAPTAVTRPSEARLRFVGSHDLTIDILAQQIAAAVQPYQLSLSFRGSLGGLMALARGEAEISGIHLWDEATDSYNIPFVQRVLPGARVALVTLAYRSIGLILPPGNPQKLVTLADLAGEGVRWANRQAGSGTRVWVDGQLRRLGIDTEKIDGYDQEKTTHLEVAQAVQDGSATAGLGIYAAAAAYSLDFIPLNQEIYQLAIPETVWQTGTGEALLAVLRSAEFTAAVETLGGYDTAATGELVWVN
jgi:molybdate-binding protein/DNA-binding transcriptional regulator YhcF (GntR family)